MYGFVLIGLIMALLAGAIQPEARPPDTWRLLLGMAVLTGGVLAAGLALGLLIQRRRWALVQDEQRFLRLVGFLSRAYRLLVVGSYAAMLFVLHWPRWVAQELGWQAPDVLTYGAVVLPFIVLLVLSWTALFWADQSLRALMFQRAGVGSLAGQWTLRGYVGFMFRQHVLIILAPLLALQAFRDLITPFLGSPDVHPAAALSTLAIVGLGFLFSGVWMRVCWRTDRLPESEIRNRLTDLLARARIVVRSILIWRTNLTIVNGCMVGLIGPLRYIMITDALLVGLPAAEVEAVFAHEVGHVKHLHVPLYVLLAVGGVSAMGVAADWVLRATHSGDAMAVATGVLALLFWWLVFGFVSRRCELEADLYAAEMTACPEECSPAREEPAACRGTARICPHRVAVFASVLRRISRLNGTAETARGWRHFSIARRCLFLETMLAEPPRVGIFRRKMRLLKGAVTVAAAIALAAACLTYVPEVLQPDDPQHAAGPGDVREGHAARLERLVDRDQVDDVALGSPKLDGDADVPAPLDEGRLARSRGGVAPAHHDVAVEDAGRHAAAVDAQGEGAMHGRAQGGQVDEFDHAVGRRLR
jgi:STE24 endopeptidase